MVCVKTNPRHTTFSCTTFGCCFYAKNQVTPNERLALEYLDFHKFSQVEKEWKRSKSLHKWLKFNIFKVNEMSLDANISSSFRVQTERSGNNWINQFAIKKKSFFAMCYLTLSLIKSRSCLLKSNLSHGQIVCRPSERNQIFTMICNHNGVIHSTIYFIMIFPCIFFFLSCRPFCEWCGWKTNRSLISQSDGN